MERRALPVLGGTFDPLHNAHMQMAEAARDALRADEVWLLPARQPQLRGVPVASDAQRLEMVWAAAEQHPWLRVVEDEMRQQGPSYTVDTWNSLERKALELELWWVLGADAIRRISEWHRSAELRGRARFLVFQRAGTPVFTEAEVCGLGLEPLRTRVLRRMPPPISASEVRRRVATGQSIGQLVPAPVAEIISAAGLYRDQPAQRHNGRG